MALDIEPASVVTHELLALSYELGGMYDKAMEAWQRFLTLSGDARLLESVNDTFSRQGYRPARQLMLRERVRQLTERSKRQFVHPVELAFVYSALGNKEQTLKWLEKGYEEKDWALFEINTRPEFEPLRSEPRFLALLRKMGLPTEVVLP